MAALAGENERKEMMRGSTRACHAAIVVTILSVQQTLL
jgi:hypothetical protein